MTTEITTTAETATTTISISTTIPTTTPEAIRADLDEDTRKVPHDGEARANTIPACIEISPVLSEAEIIMAREVVL